MNRPESVLCDPKMTLIFGLILIFVTSVKTECTEQNCPEVKNSFNNGSFVNGESLQSECKPGYYRLNISDYKSKCYKFDCPGESKKVNNATHPSMIPTCICDTERNYWGNDSLNCHYKDPPCPSGKLVRETGKCDCEPGFYYIDGSCIAQDSHSSSLVPDLHSTSLAPVNNTESHGNLGRQAIIAISVGGVIFVVIIVIVICCTCYIQKKRRKQQSKESKMEEGVTSPLTGNNEGSEENQSSSTPVPNLERHVANALNASQSVVNRAWNRHQTFGTAAHRHGGGRQRSTTVRQDHFVALQARRHPFLTATTLRNDHLNASGVNVSTQTLRNRLHNQGLNSRRACVRIPLTVRHRRERLNWAQDHVTWTPKGCAPVLFMDESRYCLDFTDSRQQVWRRQRERFHDANISEHDRYGGGSIMVLGGISRDGRTDLHVMERGTMTEVRYKDEILDVHVRPYAGAVGPEFILMDDNARPHRARAVEQ